MNIDRSQTKRKERGKRHRARPFRVEVCGWSRSERNTMNVDWLKTKALI